MFHDDDVSNERGKPFVYDVAFSYDAKRLLVGGRDGVGRIWDCNVEDTFYVAKLLITLETHQSAVLAVAWSADAKRVATASKDRAGQDRGAQQSRLETTKRAPGFWRRWRGLPPPAHVSSSPIRLARCTPSARRSPRCPASPHPIPCSIRCARSPRSIALSNILPARSASTRMRRNS